MALVHSRHTVITANSVDFSGYCKSSEFSKTTDTHDTTHYGADAKEYYAGLNDATFTMSGDYDSTATTGPRAALNTIYALNAAVALVRRPEGTGSSLPQDAFNAVLTAFAESSPVGDMVTWSAEWQVSGTVDISPQSA